MTIKSKLPIFILLFSLLIIGCGEDDDLTTNIPDDEKFVLNIELFGSLGEEFLVVSKPDGTVVFDTIVDSFYGTILLNASMDEELTVTTGFENESNPFFTLQSYTNVKSGFMYSSLGKNCENIYFGVGPVRRMQLTIENTPPIDSMFLPFNTISKEYDVPNQTLTMTAYLTFSDDHLITLKTMEETDFYKSYLLESEVFDNSGDTIFATIDFNDFISPSIQYIGVEEENILFNTLWQVGITGYYNNGKTAALSKWGNFEDYQVGPIVRFFDLPTVNFDQYLIDISNSLLTERVHYKWLHNTPPEMISFYEPDVQINEKNTNSYKLSLDGSIDLIKSVYQYRTDNYLNHWEVFEIGVTTINTTLPTLPANILNQHPLIAAVINDPEKLSVIAYEIEGFSEGDSFSDTTIECLEYSSNAFSEEF